MPEVSIIVAIFNSAASLRRCLGSLQNQCYENIEVIMVDDGSTDESGAICDEYSASDNRFITIHQQNRGVAAARQTGLDNSTGKYVIHADADDYVDQDMITVMCAKAEEDKSDVVIADFFEERDGKTIYHCQKPVSTDHFSVQKDLFGKLHGSCWNKLVRKSAVMNAGITFNMKLSYCEDLLFNALLLSAPIKVSYVPKAFYHYVVDTKKSSLVSKAEDRNIAAAVSDYDIFMNTLPDCEARVKARHLFAFKIVEKLLHGKYSSKEEAAALCGKYGKDACIYALENAPKTVRMCTYLLTRGHISFAILLMKIYCKWKTIC